MIAQGNSDPAGHVTVGLGHVIWSLLRHQLAAPRPP